jgi:acyl-CoA synthetase (AMP-forming)/AMP-acid ligase II
MKQKVPEDLALVAEIPRNSLGKTLKTQLREGLQQRRSEN